MSTPLHVLLKADPCLEGDVEDDKADHSVCVQLHHISLLQYFLETAGSIQHQHVLRQAVFFRSSCHRGCTVLANREGWQVAGELVPQEQSCRQCGKRPEFGSFSGTHDMQAYEIRVLYPCECCDSGACWGHWKNTWRRMITTTMHKHKVFMYGL